ncbi:MAG: heavy metal translocating P-type ATPase [Clostridia bacterium]|nr:heavy metal translocating P-type ATPase [Clostridia bacterium]
MSSQNKAEKENENTVKCNEHNHEHNEHCEHHHHEHGDSCGCGHHHEHGDGCGCGHDHHHDEDDVKKGIIRIVTGVILLAGAITAEKVFQQEYISICLFVAAYLVFGYDVVINAVKSIIKGRALDEHFLMAFATICAFCLGEYVEAVSVMLFYQIGEFLQETIVNRSRKSIKSLMDMQVDTANILVNGNVVKTEPDKIKKGDTIVVKPGEKVPVDGTIIKGETTLDMVALTGESLPVEKNEGESVLSGSINNSNVIYVKADKEYKDSTVARIMEMVENASENKSKAENFVTRFAKIYTPVVVAMAVLLAVVPVLFGYDFREWLNRALIFLVASCPCALVLSIPLTFFAGIGTMSKHGVLVKGGNYLEALSNIDAVVMDKTGTITKGKFEVTECEGDGALKYAASVERFSTHPIALAITEYYKGEMLKVEDVENMAGFGLKAVYEGKTIYVGSERLMVQKGIKAEKGKNVYVAIDNKCIGYINVEDTVKADSKTAISQLKNEGIKNITMLTGDKKSIAERVGYSVGVDNVCSELLPQDKVEQVEKLYEKNYKAIAAVGDGINDAPVLARADVGIAMGGIGADAAIEAADVVIMEDSLAKLPVAIRLAKRTIKICRQNVFIVIALKILVLAITALGYGNMWIAVFADVGVALIAVINATRITKVKKNNS